MEYHLKSRKEVEEFIINEVLTTGEAIELLGITRQNLNSLVKRGKLKPIKELPREKLFLKSDLMQRKKEQEELRKKYRPYDN